MKKKLAILLVAVMLLSALAGCGATTDKQTTNSTTGSTKNEPTITVKWYVPGDKAPDHDLVMADLNAKLKEKINVELDLQFIVGGEFNDKMKLISTSGEDYDLTFTAGWRNNFYDNMAREAFAPLDDLLASDGQGILKEVPEWLFDVARVNEKIYAVPNKQVIAYQQGFYIQKAYLDKYKFDITTVKTLRDIEPFLQMIKDNEPNLIPFRHSGQISNTYRTEYEGFATYNALVKIDDPTLTAGSIMDNPLYIEQCHLQNDWYKKGYVRQDIATITDDTADAKANKYVVQFSTYKPGGAAEQTAMYGVEMIDWPIGKPFDAAVAGNGTMTALSVNSKNPEAAIKLLNVIYTDKELFNELLFGIEGTHYTKPTANSVEPVANSKYNFGTLAWQFGNQFLAWYLPGQAEGIWEQTDKMNNEARISPLRGFTLDAAPIQAELAQVAAVEKEYDRMFYVVKDVDALIAEMKEKKNKAGLPKVVEEVQKQIDAWAKAHGKK